METNLPSLSKFLRKDTDMMIPKHDINQNVYNVRNQRCLTQFEIDAEKEWALKQEQKKQNRQEYTLQKRAKEEEEKNIKKEQAVKTMQYLLGKSQQFSKFFKDKLQHHTQQRVEVPLHDVQSKILPVVKPNRKNEHRVEAVKFNIMDKLRYFKGVLKPYQVEGIAWMSIIYENGVNGILADEMGLGKTVEVIALICHLYERKVPGPYLIVAPLSTLPNWLSEFRRFAPAIPVVLFHGSKEVRLDLKDVINGVHKIQKEKVKPVVITSYRIILSEAPFLRLFTWQYLIVDEGQRLKDPDSLLKKELSSFKTANKLLLTGTPLQNNLRELWSLLNFLLPQIFTDSSTFDSLLLMNDLEEHKATSEKTNLISTVHSILAPFMLRRLKTDVLLNLVPKKEVLVYCPLSQLQKDLYVFIIERDVEHLTNLKYGTTGTDDQEDKEEEILDMPRKKRTCRKEIIYHEDRPVEYVNKRKRKSDVIESLAVTCKSRITMQNRLMMYRKVVNHPYLVHLPLDPKSTQPEMLINEDLVNLSGKMLVLDAMLPKLKKDKHKVLLFSTLVMMLDIIEAYAEMRGYNYCRLDGDSKLSDRQKSIDSFNNDPNIFLFLISTRAGGLGVNLTAADTVILYDRDWNPQVDIQAQDRCHRIGQTRPVMVYSLLTKNTIDERIVTRGNAKKKLEKLIIESGNFKTLDRDITAQTDLQELKALQELIESDESAHKIQSNGYVFSDQELDQLLDRSELYKDMKHPRTVKMKHSRNGNKEN